MSDIPAAPEAVRHVIHFGNPVVHLPKIANGNEIARALGRQTSTMGLPEADATPLVANEARLDGAFQTLGREGFLSRLLLNHWGGGNPLELWEIPYAHVYRISLDHAAAGFDWAHCESNPELERVLAKLFAAEQGPQDGYDEQARWREANERLADSGEPTALKTTAGFEAIGAALFGPGGQPAQFGYMAITNNAHVPAAGDTELTSENVTGGLKRRATTPVYTSGTHKTTISATFTAEAANVGELPYKIKVFGILNKVTSGGTLGIETELGTSAELVLEGDNATISDAVTES